MKETLTQCYTVFSNMWNLVIFFNDMKIDMKMELVPFEKRNGREIGIREDNKLVNNINIYYILYENARIYYFIQLIYRNRSMKATAFSYSQKYILKYILLWKECNTERYGVITITWQSQN